MRLHIIRHGDPDYVRDTLTERGRREADALREWTAREAPDRAYHSPMGRARLTAELALAGSGLVPTCEPWTAELSPWGPLPGEKLAYWDQHGHRIRNPAFLASHRIEDVPGLDAPEFLANLPRVAAASDAFLARHGLTRDGGVYRVAPCDCRSIAVFCHMGFGLTWLAHLLATAGCPLLDCQLPSAHLASLGSELMPRPEFLAALAPLVVSSPAPHPWPQPRQGTRELA